MTHSLPHNPALLTAQFTLNYWTNQIAAAVALALETGRRTDAKWLARSDEMVLYWGKRVAELQAEEESRGPEWGSY